MIDGDVEKLFAYLFQICTIKIIDMWHEIIHGAFTTKEIPNCWVISFSDILVQSSNHQSQLFIRKLIAIQKYVTFEVVIDRILILLYKDTELIIQLRC